MEVEFDEAKDATNRSKHGISLALSAEFDFDTCLYIVDDSQDYGEIRIIAVGFLRATLHVPVFSPRNEEKFRAIMLRKATPHERKKYAEEF